MFAIYFSFGISLNLERSVFKKSSKCISTFFEPSNLSSNSGLSLSSISNVITFFAFFAISSVRIPLPVPISIITSFSSISLFFYYFMRHSRVRQKILTQPFF